LEDSKKQAKEQLQMPPIVLELACKKKKQYSRILSLDEDGQQQPLSSTFDSFQDEITDDTNTNTHTHTNNNWKFFRSFWILGLLNNAPYVLMLACAKNISEGGTALVFLANVIPGLSIKVSAPYWFDHVGYNARITTAALVMIVSFALVAIGSHTRRMECELLGVACASAQCALGEASLLALAGKCDGQLAAAAAASSASHPPDTPATTSSSAAAASKGQCLTSFSSGTGLAGVFGFFWKWFWNDWLGFSLSATVAMAMIFAIFYFQTYVQGLWRITSSTSLAEPNTTGMSTTTTTPSTSTTVRSARTANQPLAHIIQEEQDDNEETPLGESSQALHGERSPLAAAGIQSSMEEEEDTRNEVEEVVVVAEVMQVHDMDSWQRFCLVVSLWPYMIPLFVVYVAEYALMAGTWTAIGFPVTDIHDRYIFYEYSNWMVRTWRVVQRRIKGTTKRRACKSRGALFRPCLLCAHIIDHIQFIFVCIFSIKRGYFFHEVRVLFSLFPCGSCGSCHCCRSLIYSFFSLWPVVIFCMKCPICCPCVSMSVCWAEACIFLDTKGSVWTCHSNIENLPWRQLVSPKDREYYWRMSWDCSFKVAFIRSMG
jgi:hypothetical protein